MKEYPLSLQYAIVGLNNLDSLHSSMAKNAAIRAIAAARLLEKLLLNLEDINLTIFKEEFESGLLNVKKMKKQDFKSLEIEVANLLEIDNTIEQVPDLLACDIYYYTSGIDMKSYHSEPKLYLKITESVRAEILEEGSVSKECVCLLWLFRESGCMHDIFSVKEQEAIENRMLEIITVNEIYKLIWQSEFHNSIESMANHLINSKKNLFKNPYLEGITLIFPFLDRRKAVFIDFVILDTTVRDRRLAVMTFLTEKGFYVEDIKNGDETLLKINNAYYRIFPKTIGYGALPVQGVSLLPVYK